MGRTGGNRRKGADKLSSIIVVKASDLAAGEFKLDAKSVSRKHITLDVAPVKAGSGVSHTCEISTVQETDIASPWCTVAQSST